MKINKEGIWIKSGILIYSWPWNKKVEAEFIYPDTRKGRLLKAAEYLGKYRITAEEKVQGYSLEDLVLCWIKNSLQYGQYVVLYDINVSKKSSEFWTIIPEHQKVNLTKDMVLLTCKDVAQVKTLCDSIDINFASAIGVSNGEIFYWNET